MLTKHTATSPTMLTKHTATSPTMLTKHTATSHLKSLNTMKDHNI
jgi:hypothetical protein